jgi:pyridoxine 4-dehydrogenase
MPAPTRTLAGKQVGPIGFGMMGMTWEMTNPTLPSQQDSFAAMDAALASNANFFNGGENYGTPTSHSGHLLRDYLLANPQHASKITLSIKGGMNHTTHKPDGSATNARRSVEDTLASLNGTKSQIDIFEYARVDRATPIEDTLRTLKTLQSEGKIAAIALSEVSARTIMRAATVTPIAAVEIELSLWSTENFRNGVVETCARLNIPIVAYSPLMRGALTDGFDPVSKRENGGVFMEHLPKFMPEHVERNMRINAELDELAKRKSSLLEKGGEPVTKAQLAINWVAQLSGRKMKVLDVEGREVQVVMPTVIPIPGSTKAERVKANSRWVGLSDDEMDLIWDAVQRNPMVSSSFSYSSFSSLFGLDLRVLLFCFGGFCAAVVWSASGLPMRIE